VILLLSTYDLGRQPFGLASPAAWLRRDGFEVVPVDLSRQPLDPDLVARARLVAVHLPMHTATRLALPVLDRVRAVNPKAVLCAYGLYAPLNRDLLEAHGVTEVLGPEFEADLVALAETTVRGCLRTDEDPPELPRQLPRLAFIQPDRADLLPPARYASVVMPDGSRRLAGSTDASRGCKHRCRHCPIVPVYDGQFRVVPLDVVLADIRAQVAHGAEHITFGDPDFLNGPTHAMRIVESLHDAWPHLTYDVTIKVEHLLRHRRCLPTLAATRCLFVTSAVESVEDEVLARLEKRHTRADFVEAVQLCRETGIALAPTFVAFTPWTTLESYAALLDTVETLGLVGHVAPVQWGIRLLVTERSRLLELDEVRTLVGAFDPRTLTYPWTHPDARVDRLQETVMQLVGVRATRPRHEVFAAMRRIVGIDSGNAEALPPERHSRIPVPDHILRARATIPYLNEPWYC
jgi:radical SAM superfamily enzyme YgiQ (UPF0313 family)